MKNETQVKNESIILNWEFTKFAEGFNDKPYYCPSGKMTIGYGHNLNSKGLTKHQAEHILYDDLSEVLCQFNTHYPSLAKRASYIRGICYDMIFNLGIEGFGNFKKFIAALLADDIGKACLELVDSQWFGQVGNRSKMLFIALYEELTPDGLMNKYPNIDKQDELDRIFAEELESFDNNYMPHLVKIYGKIPKRYIDLVKWTLGYEVSLGFYK